MKKKLMIESEDEIITGLCASRYHTEMGIRPDFLERKTGMKIDMVEYKKLMDEHRKISRKGVENKFGRK